ncbi:GYD domain-containing protein [Micromonospora sp. BQ11]|uniref:GYD domain-containing protein n=1 Tax=Micromonospora sp. BQ11 TaxID=3452212 RepID=UPI003F8AB859
MARFLFTATYTAEGIKGLGKDGGTTRAEVVQALIENSGGRVEALYFAFGEHDLYIICELPDQVSAAALGIRVRGAGGVEATVVPLLTPGELDAAAGVDVTYQAPGR